MSVDAVTKYLEKNILPELEDQPFSVLYLHAGVEKSENFPGISGLRAIYDSIPIAVRENIEAVYFVHPGLQSRLFLATFGRFIFAGGIHGKIKYVSRVDYLWEHLRRKEVELPEFVYDHDEYLEYRPMIGYGLEGDDHPRVYAMVERSIFNGKDGGATASTTIVNLLFFIKNLLFSPFTTNPRTPSFPNFFDLISFHVSLLLFSTSVFVLSTPHPRRAASQLELLLALARIVFLPKSSSQPLLSPDFRRRARVCLCFVLFMGIISLSAAISIISVCWSSDDFSQLRPRRMVIRKLGFRGLGIGLFYGSEFTTFLMNC
nr:ganglioside-induced differentiation-associated protein 2 [Ipomoea batatas]